MTYEFVQKNDSNNFLRWLGDKGTQKDVTRRQDYSPWKASLVVQLTSQAGFTTSQTAKEDTGMRAECYVRPCTFVWLLLQSSQPELIKSF